MHWNTKLKFIILCFFYFCNSIFHLFKVISTIKQHPRNHLHRKSSISSVNQKLQDSIFQAETDDKWALLKCIVHLCSQAQIKVRQSYQLRRWWKMPKDEQKKVDVREGEGEKERERERHLAHNTGLNRKMLAKLSGSHMHQQKVRYSFDRWVKRHNGKIGRASFQIQISGVPRSLQSCGWWRGARGARVTLTLLPGPCKRV